MKQQGKIVDPAYIIEFRDHTLLLSLMGPSQQHLHYIESFLDVRLMGEENRISIIGKEPYASKARDILKILYQKLNKGQKIGESDVQEACRFKGSFETVLKTQKRSIDARSKNQENYIKAIQSHDIVFAKGPAGTGKTYLAVAAAVSFLLNKNIKRLILTRPALEAGEHLGFLPGDIREKVDPYLRPLYDALYEMLPDVEARIHSKEIEIAPLAFMRGRTLNEACIILDEAQNTTPQQMKMFLTRLGHHCKMIVTGDLTQIDLPPNTESGMHHAMDVLKDIPDIKMIHFDETDVMRHTLVSKIIKAYETKNHPED